MTARRAYSIGWRQSEKLLVDLGTAEGRFTSKHGWGDPWQAWLSGWMDYACDRDKFHLLECGDELSGDHAEGCEWA